MAKMETLGCGDRKEHFKTEKRQIIKAAKELCYKPEIIEALSKATTSHELTRIMIGARRGRDFKYE